MSGGLARSTVLVTGGTGFIGRHLVDALVRQGAGVRVLSRQPIAAGAQPYTTIVGDLTRPGTLEDVCRGVDTVFHLGGHAHAVDQPDASSELLNQQVTVEGTRVLLEQSLKAGVSRFLLFSSVKAMGEGDATCLDETSRCQPTSAYGRAKHEAERLVLSAGSRGLAATVLRLPMVYGPGCKGNLPRMIHAIMRRRFPPLPETGNRRSMVDVRDVVQAALLVTANPVAAGKTYIITDGQTYSTRQIYEWICAALGRPASGWAIPLAWLRAAARVGDAISRVTGKRFVLDTAALDKLLGSACYNSEKISRELGYRPIHALRETLPGMVMELRSSL